MLVDAAAAANAGFCCQDNDEPTAQQMASQAQAQPGQAQHSAQILLLLQLYVWVKLGRL